MTSDMKEYHKRPVLSARVDAGLKAWALAEAKRPGLTLGAVVDEALSDLRAKRTVNHVVDAAPVAAEDEQPQPVPRRAHALTCKCMTCKPEGGK